MKQSVRSLMKRYSFYFAWLVATVGCLISLYYSEIKGVEPCKLCWLQRVFLFPLPLILFPLIFHQKKEFIPYVLSLPILGLFFASYQTFSKPPCCYISPLPPSLGVAGFSLIIIFLLWAYLQNAKKC
jgi:disulfide bond formation protein DsbB